LHSDGVEDSVSNEYLAVGINRKIINGHKLFSSASIRLDNKNLTKMYRETVSPNEQLIKDKDVLQAVEGIVFFKQVGYCTELKTVNIIECLGNFMFYKWKTSPLVQWFESIKTVVAT